MGLKTKMQATCDQCGKDEEISVEFNDFVELDGRQMLAVDLPREWRFRRRYGDVGLYCDCFMTRL